MVDIHSSRLKMFQAMVSAERIATDVGVGSSSAGRNASLFINEGSGRSIFVEDCNSRVMIRPSLVATIGIEAKTSHGV